MIKMFVIICAAIALALNMMMSDANNIYKLYAENATQRKLVMFVRPGGGKEWRLNGKLHRDDGPAVEYEDGINAWYQHGKLHRIGAPAAIGYNGDKLWYQHDRLHREDGAAVEKADGDKEWWLHGKKYKNANAWAQAVLKMHHKPHAADDAQRFLRVILTKDDLI
jgi:hypothetical protein